MTRGPETRPPPEAGRAQDASAETDRFLREAEARTQRIVEAMPIGLHLYRLEPDGRLVFTGANPAADRILGVENARFVGLTIEEAFPPLAATEIPGRYREVARTGAPWETESVAYEDGAIKGAFAVHAFLAGPGSVVVAFHDITERKRSEEALRQSEERFRMLTEALPLAVFEIDLAGHFTYANHAALATFGYAAEEVAQVSIERILGPASGRARAMLAERLAGRSAGYLEYEAFRKDGTTLHILVGTSVIRRGDRPVGFRGIATDLTERKRLEEELLRTQKLESIGTLAGGIAHDFNNLLQGIFGLITMARAAIDDRASALALLGQAESALHRSVGLTTQLLTFAKGGKPVKKVVDLAPIVAESVHFALSGSKVVPELTLAPDLRAAEVDANQIAQVIQNIVLNADQAMPGGGRITVEARNAPGDTVEIAIRDTGVGIPPEHLPRIFDPYFTTKEKGSGLGLATSYAIVRSHGGSLGASSELGVGTTFTIRLPSVDRPARPAGTTAHDVPAPGRRILVMDDEAIVRRVSASLLESLGCVVEVAEDGERAIVSYKAALDGGRPFDAVILDLTVRGGMGGREALARLRELDPGVRAIVSSGYSAEAPVSDHREFGFLAALAKPYDRAALQQVLHQVLG
jgi:two-component system cell cycle sensor histidine kinase/response regulator CckA